MTEDDTFIRLKRLPLKELLDLWTEYSRQSRLSSEVEVFLMQYGWTYDEFFKTVMRNL